MSLGGIIGFIAVLAFGGLVLFIAGARTINTTPAQCASCHPEVTAMWEESLSHPAGKVTCYECHAQHAELPDSVNLLAYLRDKFIPEKYLLEDMRVESRCVECHGYMDTVETEKKKLIKVNHKKHLSEAIWSNGVAISMGCLDCHRNVAHDKARTATNRPPMSSCFVGGCHAEDSNKDRCERCHYQMLKEPGKVL